MRKDDVEFAPTAISCSLFDAHKYFSCFSESEASFVLCSNFRIARESTRTNMMDTSLKTITVLKSENRTLYLLQIIFRFNVFVILATVFVWLCSKTCGSCIYYIKVFTRNEKFKMIIRVNILTKVWSHRAENLFVSLACTASKCL